MNLSDEIIGLLKTEPMKAAQIADALKVDKKDVEKELKKLQADGKIHSPKRCYYLAT